MIIDEIKKANMQALKEHDKPTRAALSVVINKYMLVNVNNREQGKETTDAEVIAILQKTLKELTEEHEMYLSGNNAEKAGELKAQIEAVNRFLPQMMSEEKIKEIILSLEDRSIKNVMAHFKTNYAGQVDMSAVSKVLKTL